MRQSGFVILDALITELVVGRYEIVITREEKYINGQFASI
jgi:hypothetical protein